MKRSVLQLSPLLMLATCVFALLCLPSVSSASSPPADSVHFCAPFDYEQWRRDHPRPAAKPLAALDAGDPRTVRMIYFVPKDRSPQSRIDERLQTLIRDVQQSFSETMEYHGFGRKTFVFEADKTGTAVVHRLDGKFNDEYYQSQTFDKVIWKEIGKQYDLSKNIYLVVLDADNAVIDGYCGQGASYGPEGGVALIPAPNLEREHERGWSCFNVAVAAHELGHTFGLAHDHFRKATRSPSSYHTDWMVTSFCAAEWLGAHRCFNIGQSYPGEDEQTTIQMLPPRGVPPYAIRLRFEVTDPDGLHQTQLHNSAGEAIGCQGITGGSATVEFVTPEAYNGVSLRVVDVYGNVTQEWYPIDIAALLSPEIVSMPDTNLAAVVTETLDLPPGDAISQLDMLRLGRLEAAGREITDLTGLEYAVNLTGLFLGENQISDIKPLVKLTILESLELHNNNISDLSPLARLPNLTWLILQGNPLSYPSINTHIPALQSHGVPTNVDFYARTPSPPVKISGDKQEAPVGTALSEPFVVSVLDENGAPFEGVPVAFAVIDGEGMLSVETTVTDSSGIVSSTLTLGRKPGTNTVAVKVAGLEPVTFTAVGQATPDFDGDGTVGFGDFVLFAARFGLSQADAGYDARYDLDGNETIGFGDFVIFANNFGKETSSS